MKQKNLLVGLCLSLFSVTSPTFAQGWKTDINFMDAGNAVSSQIYKGVIDEDDHTYLLMETRDVNGYRNTIREFLPDGSSGFINEIALGPVPNYGIQSHFGGGIDTDDNFIFYTDEIHPTGSAGFGSVDIKVIEKADPAAFYSSIGAILGDFYVTELIVKNDALYVYGFTEGNTGSVEFIDPGQASVFLTQNVGTVGTPFLAKYDLSGGVGSHLDLLWAKSIYTTGTARSTVMEVDDADRVYLGAGVVNGAQIMNTSSTIAFNTGARSAGAIIRLDANGNFDATFTPVVISTPTVSNSNLAFFEQSIDDIELEANTNSIYFTTKEGLYCHATNTNSLKWQSTLTKGFSMRLAVSECDELYVAGIELTLTPTGNFDDSYYFAQSYDKSNGSILPTLSSRTYGNGAHSDGEVILIQSDGDKVIAADYEVNSSIAIDYNISNWTSSPTFPVKPFHDYSVRGSFVGIYDDGVAGKLINDFEIQNSAGAVTSVFYCDDAIFFNGLASQNETNHFIGFNKRLIGSTGAFTWHGNLNWLGGPAGISDLVDLASNASQPFSFPTGYEYEIKLAVGNECIGWLEETQTFRVEKRVISGSFSSLLNAPYVNTNGDLVFDLDLTASETDNTLEHRWLFFKENANGTYTFIRYVSWDVAHQTYTYNELAHGTLYRVIHYVRDPSGCADEQGAVHYVGQSKSGIAASGSGIISVQLQAELNEYLVSLDQNDAVSVEEVIATGVEFTLYPNPTQNLVVVDNANGGDAVFTLLSTDGRLIEQLNIAAASKGTIDLTELPDGLYIVRMLYANKTIAIKRLVKQ